MQLPSPNIKDPVTTLGRRVTAKIRLPAHSFTRCSRAATAVVLATLAVPLFADCGPTKMVFVDFDQHLQQWDGFGVNYVETAQTPDIVHNPQDYGGFKLLSESDRERVMDLIFGDDGLEPSIVKMFLDPFHEGTGGGENDNADPGRIEPDGFDHERSTRWMRMFVLGGLERAKARDRNLEIITTLYGPPGWMTRQNTHRGRDLDPNKKEELAEYLVAWVQYLQDHGYPVRYLSLHNEGESYNRWNEQGFTEDTSHDYNLFWSAAQVAEFLKLMPTAFHQHGVAPVGLTPGEPSTWFRYILNYRWNKDSYSAVIGMDNEALDNVALITSHSFWSPTPTGIDFLRIRDFKWENHVPLRAWTTSISWKSMSTDFLVSFHDEIYQVEVSAIIPWACIQHPRSWTGGDPNPGTAITVHDDGRFTVEKGYHFYKQVSRMGQPDMRVARTFSEDPEVRAIAFSQAETLHPNAFAVINDSDQPKALELVVRGFAGTPYELRRTTSEDENYELIETGEWTSERLHYLAPPKSVSTFFGTAK